MITFSRYVQLRKNIIKCSRALLSTSATSSQAVGHSWSAARLRSRGLIELSGTDSREYLQNLITNDVRHLEDDSKNCIYAFMLTHQGRVTAELFVYRMKCSDELLLECDRDILDTVQKNLNRFKLRKDVRIKHREDFVVWSIFPSKLQESIRIRDTADSDRIVVNDPRLPGLGLFRVAANREMALQSVVQDALLDQITDARLTEVDSDEYTAFRLRNGLAEGPVDHTPGNSFPLESNGDLLNGISFFKGCYVGQELTARTYHTGVTRKRFMPLEFCTPMVPGQQFEADQRLTSKDGKKRLGKLKSVKGLNAIGLVYVDELDKNGNELYLSESTKLIARKPIWWPADVQSKAKHEISAKSSKD